MKTIEATFYGGPWDGVVKQVELHPHFAVPYQTDPEHFSICYYRLERWSDGTWRYVHEDAQVR